MFDENRGYLETGELQLRDYGPEPFVINIQKAADKNRFFRFALWTGEHLQLTLMEIAVQDSIGLEMHPNLDQFLFITEGSGLVMMGERADHMNFHQSPSNDAVSFPPARHNLKRGEPQALFGIWMPAHKHTQSTARKKQRSMLSNLLGLLLEPV